jgi:ABC-type lipoprotein export system ATPase subunit
VLRTTHLAKTYQGPGKTVRALDGVTLHIAPRELVAIQGPSGCGKTTLLLISGGLLKPDAGQVLLAGQDPYALAPDARARFRAENVGFVFQQFHLIPYLSVLDNILAPALARPLENARERAAELASRFGLADRQTHVPGELSTGERQRTALARALLHKPQFLLADEPTGNLDEASGKIVLGHLAEFAKAGGAVLLVTHDPRAAEYATRTVRMESGRITQDGPRR